MNRERLSVALILFLMAFVFIACQGGEPQSEGVGEGVEAPAPTPTEEPAAEGPDATGPGVSGEVLPPAESESDVEEGPDTTESSLGTAPPEKAPEPEEAVAGIIPAGQPVYITHCAKCHKVTGRDDLGEGPMDLAGIGEKYDHDSMHVKLSEHPPGGDPYTETLGEGEIESLIEFLLTL